MNAKIGLLLSLSVVLLGSAAAIAAYPAPPAPSFGGTRRISAGQIYTSPNHTFTIVLPNCNPSAFSCPGWDVLYESEKGNHEMVTFTMPIADQTYRAELSRWAGRPLTSMLWQKLPPFLASTKLEWPLTSSRRPR